MLRRLVPDGRTHRLALPLPGGKLHLSYTACLGEEMIRQAGWSAWWQRPFPATSPTPTDEAVNLRADLPEGGQRFAEGWGGDNGRFPLVLLA
ncbi:MAG: hypothetical protein IPM39_19745 [Chloroflexi bacterium]|nr:hypothetical protein [Chloroflexota bacterium]